MPGGPSSLKRSKASRFPPARIKKIMQADEEVGKLASATPVMISKSLECFMQLLLDEGAKEARARGSKKLTAYHLKHTINSNPSFDFLLDVVSRIPDPVQGQADTAEPRSVEAGPSRRKASTANHGSASTATPASAQTQGQAGSSSSSRGRKRKTAPTSGGQGDEDAFIPPPTYPYNLSPQTQNIPHPTGAHTAAPPAWAGGGSRIKEESGRERARDEDYDEDNAGAPVMDHQPMRPGIGNLLNPSEDEVERKPMTGSVSPGGGGTGARPDSGPGPTEGPAQLANSGAAQVPESGRGMFDDYDDDDDY